MIWVSTSSTTSNTFHTLLFFRDTSSTSTARPGCEQQANCDTVQLSAIWSSNLVSMSIIAIGNHRVHFDGFLKRLHGSPPPAKRASREIPRTFWILEAVRNRMADSVFKHGFGHVASCPANLTVKPGWDGMDLTLKTMIKNQIFKSTNLFTIQSKLFHFQFKISRT